MQARKRTIVWRALAWEGQEQLTLQIGDAGIEARSELRGMTEDGTPFELRYTVELSPEWQVQHVVIVDALDEGKHLDLLYENGQWIDSGENHLEEFDGVRFVDFSLSPFTNSLPVNNLRFEGNEAQKIEVVYIDLETFQLHRAEQYYTKLGKSTYHYQDVDRPDFQADIVVDDDGLLLVYPGLFGAQGR
jgi:hypothetical protein